jgi:hypothetical protein
LAEQLPTLYRHCSPDAQSELTVQGTAASGPVSEAASLKALASSPPLLGPTSAEASGVEEPASVELPEASSDPASVADSTPASDKFTQPVAEPSADVQTTGPPYED